MEPYLHVTRCPHDAHVRSRKSTFSIEALGGPHIELGEEIVAIG